MPEFTLSVCGPVSWNHILVLDTLPAPVPHMQFARDAWWTVGGTSAGKALHLQALGRHPVLHALIADDDAGRSVSRSLAAAGVEVRAYPSEHTESHVNLMDPTGGRVSLYVQVPTAPSDEAVAQAARGMSRSTHAIVDLSPFGAAVLATLSAAPSKPMIWADLHDYDGTSEFHEPFVRHSDVVFMNDDAVDDPWQLLDSCLARGPRLAVCTRGAQGAIALEAGGRRTSVPAAAVGVIADTNGAGDAFMAGFLDAYARGANVAASLSAGAEQAVVALTTRHLHPLLDAANPEHDRS